MRPIASVVAWSVCLSVDHERELCENGRTDRDVVWGNGVTEAQGITHWAGVRVPYGQGQHWGYILEHAPTCRRSIFSALFARGRSDAALATGTVSVCFIGSKPVPCLVASQRRYDNNYHDNRLS